MEGGGMWSETLCVRGVHGCRNGATLPTLPPLVFRVRRDYFGIPEARFVFTPNLPSPSPFVSSFKRSFLFP